MNDYVFVFMLIQVYINFSIYYRLAKLEYLKEEK